MNKLFSGEKLWLFLLFILFLPFLVLSFYAHPSADDFILSAVVRDDGIIAHFKQVYFEWSGRYFGTFIVSINPLVFGWDFGYKLLPIVLLFIFYTGIYFLIKNILTENFSRIGKHLISLTIILLYINNIPSTAESIYWMTGSLAYFLPASLSLFFFGLFAKSAYSERNNIMMPLLMILLAIMIAGSNEINMLFLLELTTIIIAHRFITKRRITGAHFIVWVAVVVASFVVITAPGNYYRMESFSGHSDLAFSVKQSFLAFTKISVDFIHDPAFIIVSMLFIAFLPEFRKNKRFTEIIRISPFYAIPFSILIIASLYFVAIFSTGLNPALRIHNSVALIFIFLWFLNIAVLHNFLLNKNKIATLEIPQYLIILLVTGAIILTITRFSKEPGKNIVCEGNIFRAFYDLYYNANGYNSEMNNREKIIKKAINENHKYVEVPALTYIPATIHFIDITEKTGHWINISTARYYGLDSIKITH
jgi:hypothetical protein